MKKLFTLIALGAAVLTGFSQNTPYGVSVSTQIVPLPSGSPWAAGTATNLGLGWSSIVSVTNTSTTWNSSSNAFITATNIVSATNTSYADISVASQKDCLLIISESAGVGTNTFNVCRVLKDGTADTNSVGILTLGHAAVGSLTTSTNFPATWIGGANRLRVNAMSWVAASAAVTNPVVKYDQINGAK